MVSLWIHPSYTKDDYKPRLTDKLQIKVWQIVVSIEIHLL
jgi:hypothetical protein